MNKRALSKKIIILFILLVQIAGIIYATSKREYYHIDEFYSYGLMQYKRAFIYENEDFIGNWHNSDYYKDYLTMNEKEKLDFTRIYFNQAEDVHPPFYYLLLHIANIFNLNEFSIWPGTILNIIIFVISDIFLFLIAKEIFKSDYMALFVCFITGMSIATIETVMYVRMYQLLILEILTLIYWHIRKKDKEKLTYKDLIPLYLNILLGFLTHYYFCIIVAILTFMYVIKYIRDKKYKNMIRYICTEIIAILTGIIIFPYAIYHIFFSYRGKEVATNLWNFSDTVKQIKNYINIINKEVFNGYLYKLIGIISILCVIWIFSKKNVRKKEKTGIGYIVIPMIIYLVIIMISSPYRDLRYIMPIIPLIFCAIIYVINDFLKDICSNKIIYVIFLIISICFAISMIPKLSNNSYTYKGYEEKLQNIENKSKNKAFVYLYNDFLPKNNKIMECYGILMRVDESYIMNYMNVCEENMKKALKEKDTSNGVIIMVDYTKVDEITEVIKNFKELNQITFVSELGRYRIYELN